MGNSDDTYTIYNHPAPTATRPAFGGSMKSALSQMGHDADGWLDYDKGLRGWEAHVISSLAYDTRELCAFLLPRLRMSRQECGLKREKLDRIRNTANVFLSEELRDKSSGVESARRFTRRVLLLVNDLETLFADHLVEA